MPYATCRFHAAVTLPPLASHATLLPPLPVYTMMSLMRCRHMAAADDTATRLRFTLACCRASHTTLLYFTAELAPPGCRHDAADVEPGFA